jgi:uncharacterized protein (DUF2141 family)
MSKRAERLEFFSADGWMVEDSSRAGNVSLRILKSSSGLKSTRFTKLPPGSYENAPLIEPNGKISFGF